MQEYDAIVVGGGPSGSACASLLSAQGLRVLLLEKERFPRDKPCGDAIGGKALNVLFELGLEGKLKGMGFQRSAGLVFSSPNGNEVEIPLAQSGESSTGGYVCKRLDFDNILFENAKKTCEVMEGAEVSEVIFEGEPQGKGDGRGRAVGVKVRLQGKVAGAGGRADAREELQEFRAKVVVGADGANSVVARAAGVHRILPKHFCTAIRGYYKGIDGLRGNVEIHFLPECMPGYFWIFPLSENEANAGVGMLLSDITGRKLNLNKVLQECLQNPKIAPRFGGACLDGKIMGWSLPLASARRKCAGNGWVLLGDAASLIDPFSGEGIGNGMKSAKIASSVLGRALKQRGKVEEGDCLEYENELWKEIGADVDTSYKMQQLGSHSWLLNFIIGKAQKSGWLRGELAAMIASREAKRKATDPLFYLRVLLS